MEARSAESYAVRIAKLLAKAESTTEAEAEALFTKAQELMRKYAIDEELVRQAQGEHLAQREEIVQVVIKVEGIYKKALMDIVSAISGANDCKIVYMDLGKELHLTCTGFESDTRNVQLLNASVQLQAAKALRAWWKAEPKTYMHQRDGYKMRREFLYGFASGLRDQFRQANAAAQAEAAKEQAAARNISEEEASDSVALVLRSRKERVNEWYDNHYGKTLRSSRSYRQSGGIGASQAGMSAGRSANTSMNAGVGGSRGSLNA